MCAKGIRNIYLVVIFMTGESYSKTVSLMSVQYLNMLLKTLRSVSLFIMSYIPEFPSSGYMVPGATKLEILFQLS